VTVHRLDPDLRTTVATADCVVSMAGYNTVCDIMSYRRPSVLVPREQPSKEQSLRAERLREWGVAEVVRANELRAAGLADAIENVLGRGALPSAPVPLAGVERAVDVFDSLCAKKHAAPVEHLSPELVLISPPDVAANARRLLPQPMA
jgi:predicted glycosyltransferase